MTSDSYDEIGVVVGADALGKFNAFRLYLLNGEVVRREKITERRQLNWAHQAAADDFEDLITELVRSKVSLNVPEQLSLTYDDPSLEKKRKK